MEEVLDFKEFFNILKRRKKIIGIITILSIVIATIINFCILPPIYEAKATIMIGKSEQETNEYRYDEIMMYQNLVKTYAEIAKSDTVAIKTVDILKNSIKLSTDEIKEDVKVTFKEGTQILNISVKREEPKQTVYIINSFIKAFIEESNRIIVNGKIEIVDSATLPETPVKPNKLLNIIIVFAISLITCVGIVFVIEYFDDTIKNEIDIEKYLGLSVIGTIPKNNLSDMKEGNKIL